MKNANTILSHISSQPQFRSLKKQECYSKYIKLLSPKWQKAIAFIYVKEQTLFVATTHPGFKMELNYNRDLLKSILTNLTTIDENCSTLSANKVVIFHSKFHNVPQVKVDSSTVPHYKEQSMAQFNLPTDIELKEKFQKIKDLISYKI